MESPPRQYCKNAAKELSRVASGPLLINGGTMRRWKIQVASRGIRAPVVAKVIAIRRGVVSEVTIVMESACGESTDVLKCQLALARA